MKYTTEIVHDSSSAAPWDEEDGHGPVSEWTTRAKRPGELILCEDRQSRRYYDFQAAVKMARDVWGCPDPADAARKDYERLRAWCRGDWGYVGVVVTCSAEGVDPGRASLWGIESDATDYLEEVAEELKAEAKAEATATLAKLRTVEA